MSVKTKTFTAFGRQYRTTQFNAVAAMDYLGRADDMHPTELLARTEVNHDGRWIGLSTPRAINEYVDDPMGVLPPRLALNGVLAIVREYNFQFLLDWRGVRVPGRFQDGAATAKSTYTDPLISTLVSEGVATLRELEEYYSLEDAFKMFDVIMAKGVNQALSQEAAQKAAKRR